MKSYLRYEPKKSFGVIASPQCNIVYDCSGNLAITGALQEISVWNIRQANQIGSLRVQESNYPYTLSGDVTLLERATDKTTVAAGYSGGELRIFNYINKEVVATFRGHRSAISSIAFEKRGGVVASGGCDSDIFLWDLVTLTGICKLRGHKDAVTGLGFVDRLSQKLVVSVSKDTLFKVWDIATQHCIQTIVGHRCEIWSLVVHHSTKSSKDRDADVNGEEEGMGIRIYTGGADELIRGYRLATHTAAHTEVGQKKEKESTFQGTFLGDDENVLEYFGALKRTAVLAQQGSIEKCSGLHINSAGSLLAAQSTGKVVELFRLRDDTEARKKMKRRQKRMREKAEKDKEKMMLMSADSPGTQPANEAQVTGIYSAWDDSRPLTSTSTSSSAEEDSELSQTGILLSDEVEYLSSIRTSHKIRGFAFNPISVTRSKKSNVSEGTLTGDRALVSLVNNSLEVYHINTPDHAAPSVVAVSIVASSSSSKKKQIESGNEIVEKKDKAGKKKDKKKSEDEEKKEVEGDAVNDEGGDDEEDPDVEVENETEDAVVTELIKSSRGELVLKQAVIDLHGHRSDVRGVCLSADGLQAATCSSDGVKIWSTRQHSCLRTCATGYGVSVAFAPGGRYVITGTKDGKLQVVDTASGALVVDLQAHEGAVWSLAVRPDGKGFVTASADKEVKFWDFTVEQGGVLGVALSRQLKMTQDAMCVRYSNTKAQDKLLVAVGLLDCTVKVFFDDTLKFFLSLYGHKLPVMCLDISYDGNILISGSADKTVKIWGLDFGDCHRSLIAHEDSVTCVRFQPETHYFFSSGKDGVLKYWDADRFEQILVLPGHRSSVWGLDVSYDGSFVLTGGQDRSLRVWERGEDLVFVEEEKERRIENEVEKVAEQQSGRAVGNGVGEQGDGSSGGVAVVSVQSIESVKGGEMLMDALDLVEAELITLEERKAVLIAKNKLKNISSTTDTEEMISKNPTFQGLSPYKYFAKCLRGIKAPDLEQALMVLPFHYVGRVIPILLKLASMGLDLELCARCSVFLLRCHTNRIVTTQSLTNEITSLEGVLRKSVGSYRIMLGTNVMALKYMKREIDQKKEDSLISYDFSIFNSSGNTSGANIMKIDDVSSEKKSKDKKKKRKAVVVNVGNGNAVKQSKN